MKLIFIWIELFFTLEYLHPLFIQYFPFFCLGGYRAIGCDPFVPPTNPHTKGNGTDSGRSTGGGGDGTGTGTGGSTTGSGSGGDGEGIMSLVLSTFYHNIILYFLLIFSHYLSWLPMFRHLTKVYVNWHDSFFTYISLYFDKFLKQVWSWTGWSKTQIKTTV